MRLWQHAGKTVMVGMLIAGGLATAQEQISFAEKAGGVRGQLSAAQPEQAKPAMLASLRPYPELIWRRSSPSNGNMAGPVLYQIIFRSSAQPGFIPRISPRFTLENSLINDNGSGIIVNGSVNAGSFSGDGSLLTNVNALQMGSKLASQYVDTSTDQIIGGIKTFGSSLFGTDLFASGSLNVGTTTALPFVPLHVKGGVGNEIVAKLEAGQPFLELNNLTGNTKLAALYFAQNDLQTWAIVVDPGGFNLNKLVINDNNGFSRMIFDPAGNVSIPGTLTATNVNVTGTLTKASGSFKIDHPTDPLNKYLYHSFVESPDMMDIYNGNAVLDRKGEAVVSLPRWFEALNRDFRYQLTCIGRFAPVYVAQEIRENQFKIAGGKPGTKVSWQVTGIRHDAYANAHRIPVEEDKPVEESGRYLHPDSFQNAGQGISDCAESEIEG